jgi:hyperosmotically inducible periplasmic protein
MSTIPRLSRLIAVMLMAMFVAACAGSKTRESTGEYIDDSAITSTVKAKLLQDKEVSGLAINVETFKAVVQLSGFAKTEAERQRAAQLARSVGGVKDVKNDIRIK